MGTPSSILPLNNVQVETTVFAGRNHRIQLSKQGKKIPRPSFSPTALVHASPYENQLTIYARCAIFVHFIQENRPFSVQNIVDALQRSGVKKTAVERSLASLVSKGTITKKEYGKAKIFIVSQVSFVPPDADELRHLDEQLADTTARLATLQERVGEMEAVLADLKQQLTFAEATARSELLADEMRAKEAKLDTLGDGSTLVTKEEKVRWEMEYYKVRNLWKKYKSLITDITDQISEATGQKPSELHEQMGIETDESVDIQISHFPDIRNPLKSTRTTSSTRVVKRLRHK